MGASLDNAEIECLLGGPPRLTLDGVINHPRLPEAHKAYLDSFLDVYGGDPFMVRLLIESGRFLVYLLIVVLESAADPARRETWPTVGLLKKRMALFGLASGRHIDHLIGRLRALDLVELRPTEQDKRVRILSAGEKLRAHDRDWLVAHFTPLAVLYPEHDYGPLMRRDPEFQKVLRRACIPFLPLGAKLLALVPETLLFFNHAAGVMVIAALLQTALYDPDHPHAAVPYADVGDRFGVSRTHVRQMLVAAEESGLVKLHARGGRRVEILPRLLVSHRKWVAGGMYGHDICYLAATKAATQQTSAGADATQFRRKVGAVAG
jgi:hypothetical protein